MLTVERCLLLSFYVDVIIFHLPTLKKGTIPHITPQSINWLGSGQLIEDALCLHCCLRPPQFTARYLDYWIYFEINVGPWTWKWVEWILSLGWLNPRRTLTNPKRHKANQWKVIMTFKRQMWSRLLASSKVKISPSEPCHCLASGSEPTGIAGHFPLTMPVVYMCVWFTIQNA
jgi:hypothetical protein